MNSRTIGIGLLALAVVAALAVSPMGIPVGKVFVVEIFDGVSSHVISTTYTPNWPVIGPIAISFLTGTALVSWPILSPWLTKHRKANLED